MSFRSIRLPSHTMRPRATVGRLCLIAVLAVSCALSVSAPAANGAFAQPNRVTVIGDSVLTAVEWNAQPLSILEHGLPDVDLQIAVCRRLTGMSCPFEGERPPNLIDAVHALGNQIGATVVVEVGYNDPEQGFGDAVNTSIQTLLAAGVQRILWLNYHDWVPQYAEMNTILAQVAEQYPQVTIVDWQADSFIRYSWFQGDGIHLVQPGAVAIATLIHNAIVTALAPPPPPPPPPLVVPVPSPKVLRVGRRFTEQLGVSGGEGPYRWRVTSGRLERGLHLLANGILTGRPTKPGRVTIELAVSDSSGESASTQAVLTIRPRVSPR
jgi:Putative Ig domain